eukprot:SAG31_NODE_213_length_20124_cov_17.709613_8_plen_45_part_00
MLCLVPLFRGPLTTSMFILLKLEASYLVVFKITPALAVGTKKSF